MNKLRKPHLYVKIFLVQFITLLALRNSHKAIAQSDTLRDERDGKIYKTIKIGNQTWMAENLAFGKYANIWPYNKYSETYCYENDTISCKIFGMLYSWKEAQNVCPIGWHLPSELEFNTLLTFFNNDKKKAYSALMLGGSSGFNALLGGWFSKGTYFFLIGKVGKLWTSTDKGYQAKSFVLNKNKANSHSYISSDFKSSGLSVRCVKD